jgi:tetratricopeptide (TPR) repeat protein
MLQTPSSFEKVLAGFMHLHQLELVGENDSAAADRARDDMDQNWSILSECEKARLNGLSEDLYSLSDEIRTETKPLNPQVKAGLEEAQSARVARDFDRALSLYRRWQNYLKPEWISYLRGSIWNEMGQFRLSLYFIEHAHKLNPSNGNLNAIYLTAIERVEPEKAKEFGLKIIRNSGDYGMEEILSASTVLLKYLWTHHKQQEQELLSQIIRAISDQLAMTELLESEPFSEVVPLSYGMLGFCKDLKGQTQDAFEDYQKALRYGCRPDLIWVAQGISQYGNHPDSLKDFQSAIDLGTPMIWPYFYLAHDHLVHGRYQEVLKNCEWALSRTGSSKLFSELHHWQAIAMAQQAYPESEVRKFFEKAIEYDPHNQMAKDNFMAFHNTATMNHPIPWETPDADSMRASSLSAELFFENFLFAA